MGCKYAASSQKLESLLFRIIADVVDEDRNLLISSPLQHIARRCRTFIFNVSPFDRAISLTRKLTFYRVFFSQIPRSDKAVLQYTSGNREAGT